MKRFDRMLAMTVPLYLILAAVLWFLFYSVTPNLRVRVAAQANHTDGLRPFFGSGETGQDVAYKVEINQVMQGLEMEGTFSKPDLRGRWHFCRQVQKQRKSRNFTRTVTACI